MTAKEADDIAFGRVKKATAEGTAPRTIIGGLPLVENARLIEVTTINRRVAEQIPQRNIGQNDTLEGIEIVGRLEGYKIIVRENHRLSWFHDSDYRQWLNRRKGVSFPDAADVVNSIPQLFAV